MIESAAAVADSEVDLGHSSQLLRSLGAVTRTHPHVRKRLIGPDINYGRELLVTLARASGGWVGWEATNLRGIADELAFVALAEHDKRIANDVEIAALVNRSLHRVIDEKRVSPRFAELARSLGFRRSLRDSLLELRIAGILPDELRRVTVENSPAYDLPAVQTEYERLLMAERLVDPADVFRYALDAFDQEAEFVLNGVMTLIPSLSARGLPGKLLARLVAYGAQILDADAGEGVPIPTHLLAAEREYNMTSPRSSLAWASAPVQPANTEARLDMSLVQVDIFAAATPSEEVREVCRRVLAEGLRWDDVEIVVTDPDTYGVVVDALCQRLGFGATMLRGVPLTRTRLGRALERWLAWLDDGLPSDVLRQALEAGELGAPDPTVSSTALARELRTLRIGWGRVRYQTALERLENDQRVAAIKQREAESDEAFTVRRSARTRAMAGLATLLRTLLSATPEVPERGSERQVRCSCATLARATLEYLKLVPVHDQAETQTMARLRARLEALAEVDDEEGSFSSALATLRDALADLRAWPLMTSDRKPWSATGGMPHVTDVVHAGTTGRRRVFVVGLDGERTAGVSRQDPLLPDGLRRVVAREHLATTTDRREVHAYVLAAALASLRGRVTLSYATHGTLDGREAGPSPILLQLWRMIQGDPLLSYEALRAALIPPASAVPARNREGILTGIALLDARDVWLDALTDGALLLDGTTAVSEAFPRLAAGLTAYALASGDEITSYHGLVPDAGPSLDPAAYPDREISPSSLETLAVCPLAWFYRYGLVLVPPDDPEYDAERWLDASQRGALLHEIYERFTREYQDRQDAIIEDMAQRHILAMTTDVLARWRAQVSVPSETVFEVEAEEIKRAALAFLQMERHAWSHGDRGRWMQFETAFGAGKPPGTYSLLDGGELSIRGRADRIDELPDGTLRVVDYKTGKPATFAKNLKGGLFDGGRQLQPALYVAAVQAVMKRAVSQFEYRFPTERGGNEIVAYTAAELGAAGTVVTGLLDHVRAGAFVPTNSNKDCTFCDYQVICRASREKFGDTDSPRATWAESRANDLPVYTTMLTRRTRSEG